MGKRANDAVLLEDMLRQSLALADRMGLSLVAIRLEEALAEVASGAAGLTARPIARPKNKPPRDPQA